MSKPCVLGLCYDLMTHHGKEEVLIQGGDSGLRDQSGGSASGRVCLSAPHCQSCWGHLPTQEAASLCGPHLPGPFPGACPFLFVAAAATVAGGTNLFPWAPLGSERKGANPGRGDPWSFSCSSLSSESWGLSFLFHLW